MAAGTRWRGTPKSKILSGTRMCSEGRQGTTEMKLLPGEDPTVCGLWNVSHEIRQANRKWLVTYCGVSDEAIVAVKSPAYEDAVTYLRTKPAESDRESEAKGRTRNRSL